MLSAFDYIEIPLKIYEDYKMGRWCSVACLIIIRNVDKLYTQGLPLPKHDCYYLNVSQRGGLRIRIVLMIFCMELWRVIPSIYEAVVRNGLGFVYEPIQWSNYIENLQHLETSKRSKWLVSKSSFYLVKHLKLHYFDISSRGPLSLTEFLTLFYLFNCVSPS